MFASSPFLHGGPKPLLLVGLCSLIFLGGDWPSHQLASKGWGAERPNIVLLLSDDHSYPFVGCYGDPNVSTPVLDRLAAEGLKCHRFFTAAPQCVPSRASLMTGRSPVAARMTRFSSPLPRDEISLPELLRDQAGYYTGICGRNFHLDGSNSNRNPAADSILEKYHLKTFQQRVDVLNQCPDPEVGSQVKRFLDAKPEGKPFFLWANFSDPHHPWNPDPEDRPDPSRLKLPAHWPDYPELRMQLADYFGEINRLDRRIGEVVQILRDRQVLEETLLVFLGDNGAALPHGKGSLYDPGSNVPCILRWPGVIQPGRESLDLLSGEDLAPTLLQAAGVPPIAKMSGRSFLDLLRGKNFAAREFIFVERGPHGSAPVSVDMVNSGYDLSRCVRSHRYKFIYNCTPWIPYAPVDSAGGPGWRRTQAAAADGTLDRRLVDTYFTTPRPVYEFYDLENDPSELINLSGRPEVSEIEAKHRVALTEKMILDCDYLPLPAMLEGNTHEGTGQPQPKQTQRKKKR
jgi:N-sulfoglucosamine sulfohydrolase